MIEKPFVTDIQDFLRYLKSEKQLALKTQENYQRDLEKLQIFCQAQNITNLNQIDAQHIRLLIAGLHRKGLSGRSLQRVLSGIRSFFVYLQKHRRVKINPTHGISAPKTDKPLPKTLDVDQVNQLLEINGDSWLDVRDRAVLELFYSSGLRLSELCSLNLADLDLRAATVRVTGKGNKTRELPVGRYACKALTQWLRIRDEVKVQDAEALFLSKLGKRLSSRSVQKRLEQHSIRQGMASPINPHMLRHSFASHMLESSSDLRAVQELLGHANISTTQVYTHLDFQHLAKVYDKAHPRAQKKTPADKAPVDKERVFNKSDTSALEIGD